MCGFLNFLLKYFSCSKMKKIHININSKEELELFYQNFEKNFIRDLKNNITIESIELIIIIENKK